MSWIDQYRAGGLVLEKRECRLRDKKARMVWGTRSSLEYKVEGVLDLVYASN